jgi:dienelactone hydrolase
MRSSQEEGSPAAQYPRFIRGLAPSARAPIKPPATVAGWDRRLASVRSGLARSLGRTQAPPCPLEPEILGTLERPGIVIERLTFQSRPGVRVTANLYRPDSISGRLPAVLSVHGHWAWARIDPVVQTRCIALARQGYVCLCVDAFGAGERAIEPGPGTYHGGLVGASLWPAGMPLFGLQINDNRRAVDYLISRPEVDASRLAVTGASGGGNQTLYAGATDDRLAVVVPVCGVGTYESYLTTACCVCEVNPGGLTYATTGDLLAMMAPRALLVISATRDANQFSVGEAAKSIAYARRRYELLGQSERIRHLAIESGHDYNRPMREAMYGWLERWLKGNGNGEPLHEPEVHPEDPRVLRCYPDGPSRPKTIVTIPEFAYREGLQRIAALPPAPDHRQAWEAEAIRLRSGLRDSVLGSFPASVPADIRVGSVHKSDPASIEMTSEPGIRLGAVIRDAARPDAAARQREGTLIVLGADSMKPELLASRLASWHPSARSSAAVNLRAIGPLKPRTGAVAGAADHDEAEWGVWLNRPLLGQWVWDTLRWIEVIDRLGREDGILGRTRALSSPLGLIAFDGFGMVALLAAAFDARIRSVVVENCPISLVPPAAVIWSNLPMGIIAPGMLDHADVARIAALVAPRRLRFVGGIEVDGKRATPDRLRRSLAFTRSIYQLLGGGGLTLESDAPSVGSRPGKEENGQT